MRVGPVHGWARVRTWPDADPATWLGVPEALLPQVQNLFDSGYVFERLALSPRHAALEVRIPCARGEIYPVAPGIWAWSGTGGRWSRRVAAAVGAAATGPWGCGLGHGDKDDESVVWFPEDRLSAVAQEVGARRRRSTWGQADCYANLAAWSRQS